MVEGAPDYVHLRQILAKDALGNLVPVACDPSGRVILLPYGTQTVSQDDPTRTMQGSDGLDLYTIAVDAAGRLIMLPYGWDGATYRPLKVDDEGRMIGVMKGQADVRWGLRGWWKFVGSEGTTIKDYSGYSNNGSALSGVAAEAKYVDGVIGQGIYFDGINDRVTVADTDSLDISTHFSIEFYFKRVLDGKGMCMQKGDFDAGWDIAGTDNGEINLRSTGFIVNTNHQSGVIFETNEWVHVVVTYDADGGADNLIFYKNGESFITFTETGGLTINATDLDIGVAVTNAYWTEGSVDEVRIYGRALSPDEVAWRYANTNPAVGKPTRMIAVDSEGRMRVNVEGLPYKTRLVHRGSEFNALAGDYFLLTPAVPEGKMWIVTSALMTSHGVNCNELIISITADDVYYTLEYDWNPGNLYVLHYKGQIIMGAGDKMSFWFNTAGAGATILYSINGYELDVD